jgi:hypothetical protein
LVPVVGLLHGVERGDADEQQQHVPPDEAVGRPVDEPRQRLQRQRTVRACRGCQLTQAADVINSKKC